MEMEHPDANLERRKGLSKKLATAAATSVVVAALALPAVAYADPEPVPPPPAPGNAAAPAPAPPNAAPPAADPNAAPSPAGVAPAPPAADPNAAPPPPGVAPPPPADPNAPPPPPGSNAPQAPEPGRVDNAAGGFSYVVPPGWKVSDATQLSYGQALLNKLPPPGTPEPPNDTSILLGRLDLKLFAGAESDNNKAAARLASDMGEFFMPFPGTRINQQTLPLNANGMTGAASYYEVKFSDANKPNGQIWAGVVGAPTPAGTPRGQRAPERWFVVWLGSANNPIDTGGAVALANSIRPFTPPPPAAPAPPAPGAPNAPAPAPGAPANGAPPVGVPMPVTNAPPEMMPPS